MEGCDMGMYVNTRFDRRKSAGFLIRANGLAILQQITSHVSKQAEGSADSDKTSLARLVESLTCECDDSSPNHDMRVTVVAAIRIPMPGKPKDRLRKAGGTGDFYPNISGSEEDWTKSFAEHLLNMIAVEVRRTWRKSGVRLEDGLKRLRKDLATKTR